MRVSFFVQIASFVAVFVLTSCDSSSSGNSSPTGEDATKSGGSNGGPTIAYTKNNFTIPWNESINYVLIKDSRDGQIYRAVKIGSQTWMAENLNYKPVGKDSGLCFNNSPDSCAKYGRLYSWDGAVQTLSGSVKSNIRGICPEGWHVPSTYEWDTLANCAASITKESKDSIALYLKSKRGWINAWGFDSSIVNGNDTFGLRIMPSGSYDQSNDMSSVGISAEFLTATLCNTFPCDGDQKFTRGIDGTNYQGRATGIKQSYVREYDYAALRCIKD